MSRKKILIWSVLICLASIAGYGGYRALVEKKTKNINSKQHITNIYSNQTGSKGEVSLPNYFLAKKAQYILRKVNLQTRIPNRTSVEPLDYVVAQGDSVFEIARKFNIKPESLLWANYDQLNDNPDVISIGMLLKIPPIDGVYYKVLNGDTLDSAAQKFDAKVADILTWPANQLDLTNPSLKPDSWIFIPGGHREFRQWIIPVIPRGAAGVSKELYGSGACEGSFQGAYGSGSFVWPAANHYLSGNDYWSGHLGIDIGAGEGAAIYAADSGVVVFAGWATGGYGNMVMIDHGNDYQTLYAHLSGLAVSCGRSVSKGQVIGFAGSTGLSTGAHLHFEVRYMGGFINPWYVLPAS